MATKDKLLQLFEAQKGVYISGEEIAAALQLSRAAVWKAVNALRADGYPIDAVKNKGYCLSEQTDILSEQGISSRLTCSPLQLQVRQEVSSTSTLVRQQAAAGAPEGFCILANAQTDGRGRSGRFFYSPAGTGIYFSMLLRPRGYTARQALQITTMAAVAMCQAIETVSDRKPGIKWVNDIFIDGKKVCGILTEGAFGMESGMLEYAVMGIGVNLYPPRDGFPEDLRSIAGSVCTVPGDDRKNRLVSAFFNYFMRYYTGEEDWIDFYRAYSIVIGREVTVLSSGENRRAMVCGIDDACRLQLRYDSGEEAALAYGEISIRL